MAYPSCCDTILVNHNYMDMYARLMMPRDGDAAKVICLCFGTGPLFNCKSNSYPGRSHHIYILPALGFHRPATRATPGNGPPSFWTQTAIYLQSFAWPRCCWTASSYRELVNTLDTREFAKTEFILPWHTALQGMVATNVLEMETQTFFGELWIEFVSQIVAASCLSLR